jgi:hypothetical protein
MCAMQGCLQCGGTLLVQSEPWSPGLSETLHHGRVRALLSQGENITAFVDDLRVSKTILII